jgi:hypothetical protein
MVAFDLHFPEGWATHEALGLRTEALGDPVDVGGAAEIPRPSSLGGGTWDGEPCACPWGERGADAVGIASGVELVGERGDDGDLALTSAWGVTERSRCLSRDLPRRTAFLVGLPGATGSES